MKTVLLLVALLGAALAVPKQTTKIVGGAPTTIQNYPYLTSMQYRWSNTVWYQWCGGTLITSVTVLSAAHCYVGDPASSWRVQAGSSYPEHGGTVRNAANIINHAGYSDRTLDNDISIIRVVSAFPIGGSIQVAPIAGPNYILADNTAIWASGWGALWSGGPYPDIVHDVEVRTINWRICADRYEYLKTLPGYAGWPSLTAGMHCAGIVDVGGKDACQGDSGGPVSHNGNVYGVTSWGFGCANGTFPGVNAHVPFFSSWIIANGSG